MNQEDRVEILESLLGEKSIEELDKTLNDYERKGYNKVDLINYQIEKHNGRTLVHLAAGNNLNSCLELLLKYQGDPNAHSFTPDHRQTPLHLAAREGHFDCIQTLLEYGADPGIKNKTRKTPEMILTTPEDIEKFQSIVAKSLLNGGKTVSSKGRKASAENPTHSRSDSFEARQHTQGEKAVSSKGRKTSAENTQKDSFEARQHTQEESSSSKERKTSTENPTHTQRNESFLQAQQQNFPGLVKSGDIKVLMEHLHVCAHKWREIGIALGFHPGELENIRQSSPTAPVNPLLVDLLSQWSQWPTASHRDVPTLEKLRDALRSAPVGLGAVANSLPDKLSHDHSL